MDRIKTAILNLLRDEEGASAVEYALVAGLIAVVIIAGATTLGSRANGKLNQAATAISTN